VLLSSNVINNCRVDRPDLNIADTSRVSEFFNTIAPYLPFAISVGIGSGGWKTFAEVSSSPLPLLQHKPLEHAGQLGEVRLCLHVEDEVQ
jgi:hypothetical protein